MMMPQMPLRALLRRSAPVVHLVSSKKEGEKIVN